MRGSTAGSNWDNQTGLNDDDNVRVVVRCRPMNENERNRNDKQVLYVEESQTAVTLRAPGGGTYISVIIYYSIFKKKKRKKNYTNNVTRTHPHTDPHMCLN